MMKRFPSVLSVLAAALAGCCLVGSGLGLAAEPARRQTTGVHLYFAAKDGAYLQAEQRRIVHADDPVALGAAIVSELVSGPRQGLLPAVPAGTGLRALYLTPGGTAYVDLSQDVSASHSGGVQAELLTVYAIVNSLVLNVPRIKAVKVLVEGREIEALAGHVDLRFPLKANMSLIR